MIKKPTGYDEAQAFDGDFKQLPAGGYVCVVKKVFPTLTNNDKEAVMIFFDIAQGEYANYYSKIYDADTRKDKKWSGSKTQCTEDKALSFFKGFVTSIENSNPGFKFDWNSENNEKTLENKLFGGVFQREQYLKDGKPRFSTKLIEYRSVESIKKGIEPPPDKLLEPNKSNSNTYIPDTYKPNFQDVTDDSDLPF